MLVDQYGNSLKFARGADQLRSSTTYQRLSLKDIDQLIPSFDRKVLVSASRSLYTNEGVLLGAIQQKAMYAVGRSWQMLSKSADADFRKAAEEKINEEWYQVCDIRGGMNNFQTALYQISCSIDRDGEAFILLSSNANGYPRIQMIPNHRIATPTGVPDGKIEKGRYKNSTMTDGIIYNKQRPIAYCFNDKDGNFIEYIDARDVLHIYDPSWADQGRGFPAFTHALNDLKDALQSHEWERWAQLMLSSIGLIEYNQLGMNTADNASMLSDISCSNGPSGIKSETLFGGQVRYYASNSGNKLETISNDRPGGNWESFQNRIYRKALAGAGWPLSMIWQATGQGTAERADLGRAQRAVEDRQDLLAYAAKRMVSYALSKFIQSGELSSSDDWYKFEFTYPRKLTIDDGRVYKELLEMWKAGHINTPDILGHLGKTEDSHLDERFNYLVKQKLKQMQYNKLLPEGYKISDREVSMLTPNDPAEPKLAPSENSTGQ